MPSDAMAWRRRLSVNTDHQPHDDDEDDDDDSQPQSRDSNLTSAVQQADELEAEKIVDALLIYRSKLRSGTLARYEFDVKWGGRHITRSKRLFLEKTLRLLRHSVDLSTRRIEDLRDVDEEIVGIDILHLFILDLLGHDSPAGKIFAAKVESDQDAIEAVEYRTKVSAVLALILLHFLFIYYTLLLGFRKGYGWQMGWMIASVMGFALGMFSFFPEHTCIDC